MMMMSLQPTQGSQFSSTLRVLPRKVKQSEESEAVETNMGVNDTDLSSKKSVDVLQTENVDKVSGNNKDTNVKQVNNKSAVESKKSVKTNEKVDKQAEDEEYHPPNPLKWAAITLGVASAVAATAGVGLCAAWYAAEHKPVLTEDALKALASNIENVDFAQEAKKWEHLKPDHKKYKNFLGGMTKWFDTVIGNGSMIPQENKNQLILYHLNPLGALKDIVTGNSKTREQIILNLTDPVFSRKDLQRGNGFIVAQEVALKFQKFAGDSDNLGEASLGEGLQKLVGATAEEQLAGIEKKQAEIGHVAENNVKGLDLKRVSDIANEVIQNTVGEQKTVSKVDITDESQVKAGTVAAFISSAADGVGTKILLPHLKPEQLPGMLDKKVHELLLKNPKLTVKEALEQALPLVSSVYWETNLKLEHDTTKQVAENIAKHGLSYRVPKMNGHYRNATDGTQGINMEFLDGLTTFNNIDKLLETYGAEETGIALLRNHFKGETEGLLGLVNGDNHPANFGMIGQRGASELVGIDYGRPIGAGEVVAKNIRELIISLSNPEFPLFVTPKQRQAFEMDPVKFLEDAEKEFALVQYAKNTDSATKEAHPYVIATKSRSYISSSSDAYYPEKNFKDYDAFRQFLDLQATSIHTDKNTKKAYREFLEKEVEGYNGKYHDTYRYIFKDNPGLGERLFVFHQLKEQYKDSVFRQKALTALNTMDSTLRDINPENFDLLNPVDKHALMFKIAQNPGLVFEYLYKGRLLEAKMGTHINQSALKSNVEIAVANRYMCAVAFNALQDNEAMQKALATEIANKVNVLTHDSASFQALDAAGKKAETDRLTAYFEKIFRHQMNLPVLSKVVEQATKNAGVQAKPEYEGNIVQTTMKGVMGDTLEGVENLLTTLGSLGEFGDAGTLPEMLPTFLDRVTLKSAAKPFNASV